MKYKILFSLIFWINENSHKINEVKFKQQKKNKNQSTIKFQYVNALIQYVSKHNFYLSKLKSKYLKIYFEMVR